VCCIRKCRYTANKSGTGQHLLNSERTVTNFLLVQRGETAERSRLLTGTSRSLSKGVKPEGEDARSNGDIAADKFLSVDILCVKIHKCSQLKLTPHHSNQSHLHFCEHFFIYCPIYQLVFFSNLFHYTCILKICTLKLK
jgi:hypothetical protein